MVLLKDFGLLSVLGDLNPSISCGGDLSPFTYLFVLGSFSPEELYIGEDDLNLLIDSRIALLSTSIDTF